MNRLPTPTTLLALGLLVLVVGPAEADELLLPAREGREVLHQPTVQLPQPRASFGAARVGGWLYVYSGHVGPTHHHSIDNLTKTFVRFNLLDGKSWESLPCPEAVQSVALVPHGGGVIRIGGMTAKNRAGQKADLHSVKTVARFDPLTKRWTRLPDLPEGRSSHDAVVVGDTLYVMGGWSLAGPSAKWLETHYSLDLAEKTPTWTALPKPPYEAQRRAIHLAAADGKIVLMGGLNWDGDFTSEVWLFDTAKRAWSQGPDLPFKGFGVAAHAIGLDVYASGIDSALQRLSFRGPKPAWEEVTQLVFPRFFHRLVPLDANRLLAVGGVAKGGRRGIHLRNMEVLDVRDATSPRVTSWTIPVPGAAKNRQGVFLHQGALWVFGGNDSLKQHDFNPENFLDQAWRIELGTQRVEPLPAMPVKRQTMQTAVLSAATKKQGAVGLVAGGFGHTGKGTRSWDEAFQFDFKARTWTKAEPRLPRGRTQFSLVPHGGAWYAFGGLDYDSTRPKGKQFQFLPEVLRLGSDGKLVPSGIKLPEHRRAFGGAVLGDRFYMVGGMKENFTLVQPVHAWDFKAKAWVTVKGPDRPRISPLLVALNGKLYLAGGSTASADGKFSSNGSLQVYDPKQDAWSTLIERLPIETRHMRMFAWGNQLLCYSAHVDGARAVRLLVIQP